MIRLYLIIRDRTKLRSDVPVVEVLNLDFFSFEFVFQNFPPYFTFIVVANTRFPLNVSCHWHQYISLPHFCYSSGHHQYSFLPGFLRSKDVFFFFPVNSRSSPLFQASTAVISLVDQIYKTALTISSKVSTAPFMH